MQRDNKEPSVEELLEILERKRDKKLEEKANKKLSIQAKRYIYTTKYNVKQNKVSVLKQQKIHEFIAAKDFKPGDKYIEAFILYYYFKEWMKIRNITTKIQFRGFCDILKVQFNYKSTKRNRLLFGLNKDLREDYLTPQKEAAIRRWNLDENKKKRQSKKRKATDETI